MISANDSTMVSAIFLDRDGVVIENREDYVRSWDDVVIYSQAVEALARIARQPYKVVLVTNQSAVGRGIISLATAEAINERLVAEIRRCGGRIDGVFMCPHAPQDECDCRKPQPGLLLKAAQTLQIDLRTSVMIGDAWSDMLAGFNAGIPRNILVRTGRGAEQERLPRPAQLSPVPVYDTLRDALNDLIP
jgi:D-glycero-D-manno-heptose 1,7-bisphosphate phosphatase